MEQQQAITKSCGMEFGDITLTDAERQRCEIWTRVMGYYRPTDSFNTGKKQETDERKYLNLNKFWHK